MVTNPSEKPVDPFRGAKLKVQRARTHLVSLRTAQDQFFSPGSLEMRHRQLPNGWLEARLGISKELPDEATAIVADAIGNLRSSLDLAVTATIAKSGGTNLKEAYFHFAPTPEKWDETVAGRTRRVHPNVVAVMREMHPWIGGTTLLYALSKLAVADKHHLITPVATGADSYTFTGLTLSGGITIPHPNWDAEARETVIAEIAPGGSIDIDSIELSTFFAFGEVDLVAPQPVIEILTHISRLCERAIEIIEGTPLTD